MAKVRVHELAKELGITSKDAVAKLQEMGEFVRSASSTIEAPVVRKLRSAFPNAAPAAPQAAPAAKAPAAAQAAPAASAPKPAGSTPAPAPAPLPNGDGDSVWIGSPFRGTWPDASGCSGETFPSYSCSLPSVHWWLANAPRGDWGVDLQGVGAGTAVSLYAAPRDRSVPVTAKVDAVTAACSSGVIADGGHRVTVGLFVRGTRIGSVTYAHVNPSVSVGQTLNRWGQQIGTVGSYRSNNCWRGAHVHFQSYAESGYSCYNRSLTPSQAMNPSNFMGFVTGRYASGPRSACP